MSAKSLLRYRGEVGGLNDSLLALDTASLITINTTDIGSLGKLFMQLIRAKLLYGVVHPAI